MRDVRGGAFVYLGQEGSGCDPLRYEYLPNWNAVFDFEMDALETAVLGSVAEPAEEIGDCRASFHDRPVGKVDLSVVRILRDQTFSVAFVQRVEMLVEDGPRARLLFDVWHFHLPLYRVSSCGHDNNNCNRQLNFHRFLRLRQTTLHRPSMPSDPAMTGLDGLKQRVGAVLTVAVP